MKQLSPEVQQYIIELLIKAIGIMATIGLSVFVYFHKGLMRRLDNIDADLKPVGTTLAVYKEQLDSHKDRLNDHEKRLNDLETKRKG